MWVHRLTSTKISLIAKSDYVLWIPCIMNRFALQNMHRIYTFNAPPMHCQFTTNAPHMHRLRTERKASQLTSHSHRSEIMHWFDLLILRTIHWILCLYNMQLKRSGELDEQIEAINLKAREMREGLIRREALSGLHQGRHRQDDGCQIRTLMMLQHWCFYLEVLNLNVERTWD